MNRCARASCIVILLALSSCAADEPQRLPADGGVPPVDARAVLPSTEHGLMVRHWRIADRPQSIAAAIAAHAEDSALDAETQQRLGQNGWRFVRVAAADAEALLTDLGGATMDVKAWHGQAYDWRELASWPVDPAGRAVAVDGRVRRFAGGRLRLMIRGWTMLMEDGPALHLEVLPDYDRSRPTPLSPILGREVFDGERFTSMAIDLRLERRYVYLLTGESPGIDWGEPAPGSGGEPDPTEGGAEPAAPRGVIGPDAPMPLSVGELLTRINVMPRRREVFVFIPMIPDRLFPLQQEQAMDDAQQGAGS